MFGSTRGLFSAERGSTTSWLAGITSVALLIGTVALPAVATEGDPLAPVDASTSQPLEAQDVTEPAPTQDPPADPIVEPEVVEPEVVEPEVVEPEVVKPEVVEPEVVEPEGDATQGVIGDAIETEDSEADSSNSEESTEPAAPSSAVPPTSSSRMLTPQTTLPSSTIRVSKGDLRTGTGADDVDHKYAEGARFALYESATADTPESVCGTGSEQCVSTVDPSGVATFTVSVASGTYLWVGEIAPVAGSDADQAYGSLITSLTTGTTSGGFTDRPYRYRTPALSGGAYDMPQEQSTDESWSDTSDYWANRLANPTLLQKCTAGVRVAMVMDLSGSVAPFRNTYRDAAKGFVAALNDTGSTVALFSFGNEAPRAGTANYPTGLEVNDGNLGVLNDRIDTYWNNMVTNEGTNWDAGLFAASLTAEDYDLVLVLTDGNPTYSNPMTSGNGSRTTFRELERAIFSANAIKDAGARLMAVGIGDNLSDRNLAAVSGPAEYAENDSLNDFDFVRSSWQGLEGLLDDVAKALACRATITVNKLEKTGDSDPVAGDNWKFTTASNNGTLTPNTFQVTDVTGGNPTGSVAWTLDFNTPNATGNVTITETQKTGWELDDVTCTVGEREIDLTPALGVTLSGIGVGDQVVCTYTNVFVPKVPAVDIQKTVSATSSTGPWSESVTVREGATVWFKVVVENTGEVPLTTFNVTDPNAPGCVFNDTNLAVGAKAEKVCSLVPAAPGDDVLTFKNTATVQATSSEGNPPNDSDDASVRIIDPKLMIAKTVETYDASTVFGELGIYKPGQTANFKVTVTNTGNVAVEDIDITDVAVPGCEAAPFDLAVGQAKTVDCARANVQAGFVNTASAGGTAEDGQPVPAGSDTAAVKIAKIDVQKTPDSQVVNVGGTASFDVVVRNTGEVKLQDIVLTDELADCDTAGPFDLAVGSFQEFTCTTANVQIGFTNVAEAEGTVDEGEPFESVKVTDEDSADVRVRDIDIVVTKTDGGKVVTAGDPTPFPYTIKVWNQGDDALTDDVAMGDTLQLPLVFAAESEQSPDVQAWCSFVGQAMTCDIPKVKVGDDIDSAATLAVVVYAPATAAAGTYKNLVIVSTPGDEECLPGGDCEPPPPCMVDDQPLGNVACDDTQVKLGSIKARKIDLVSKAPLGDAEFQLWNDKGIIGTLEPLVDTKAGATQFTTLPDGLVMWTGLPWGNYLVEEVTAPAGYGLSTPNVQRTSVGFCDRLDPVESTNGGNGIIENNRCGQPLVFANPPLGSIEVVKIDKATEGVLPDAEFQLWNDKGIIGTLEPLVDTKEGATKFTTLPDGSVVWTGLAWGNYLVQEVTPPTGYALSTPATQPAVIDLETFECKLQPVNEDEAVPDWPTCVGMVELTFANPGTLKGIEIKKTVSRSSNFTGPDDFFISVGGKPGTTSVYRFEVTNKGNGPVSNLILTDDMFVGSSQSNPTSTVLTEANIDNCRIGDVGSTTTFTFGQPIRNADDSLFVLPPDNPATDDGDPTTPEDNEGKVFLYCDLPIPANLQLADFEAIYNTSSISGTTELSGDVKADSNFTIITIVEFDAFPIKNIVESDLTNPRKFDNLAKPTGPTTVTFDLTVDNTSKEGLYFTVYDYYENQSVGLSTSQRRAIFDTMRCIDYDNPAAYVGIPDPRNFPEYFSTPVETVFGPDSSGGGAGTYYARSAYMGYIEPGGGYELLCSVTLPAGEYNLTNTFRMVANPNPPAGQPAVVKSIMAVPMRILSMVRAAETATAISATAGGIDARDQAGVVLGVPTAEKPGVTKTADPASGSTVGLKAPIKYTIVVSNTGGTEVTGPVVDTLPAGFTATASSISDGGTLSGNTITWTVTLPAGASKTLTYSGVVNDNVANNTKLVNTVTFQNLTATTEHTVTVPPPPTPAPPVQEIEDEVVEEDEEVVAAEEDEDLADTGANNVGNLVGAALLAVLAGGLMITFGRRRREE